MNKFAALVLEIIWLALVIFCLGTGTIETWKNGIGRSYIFFILAAVSVSMYLYRRNKRLQNKDVPGK
jgi:hypothetical protein